MNPNGIRMRWKCNVNETLLIMEVYLQKNYIRVMATRTYRLAK